MQRALSGANAAIAAIAAENTQAIATTTSAKEAQIDAQIDADIEDLRSFLQKIDESEPEEIFTMADKFVSIEKHEKANARANIGAGAGADATMANPDETSKKGTLSAEAILHSTALSPTGTQVISTLDIDARVIEGFETLRNFSISSAHKRLADFVPALQSQYGPKVCSNAPVFAGSHAILDPLLLAGYIPYVRDVVDLRDEQIAECFHPFIEVDGYPTIQGVPLWERQEWERIEYYNLFKLYRDMRYAFYNESDALLVNRSLDVLSRATRVPAYVANYLSTVYNWPLRVTLYDAWMTAMQQRRSAIKRSLMLDRHSKISQALIQKAYSCLSKQADQLAPKDALEMLKLGLAYERISLGMLGDKPEDGKSTATQQAPLLSIVNQTNNTTGPMQVNNSQPTQQLQENMKKPDTLLGILSVLQRSGAFDTLVQKTIDDLPPEGGIIVE